VTGGEAEIEPRKTAGHNPALIAMFPILPELAAALAATPTGILGKPWLIAPSGKTYGEDLFGRHFRQWCDEAGSPKRCTAHGLRKACFARLAVNGASPHEILAWGGWSPNDLRMAALYTRGVDQKALSRSAGAKVAA
jgi:hypothetical protein